MSQTVVDFLPRSKDWRRHRTTKISQKHWSCLQQWPSRGTTSEDWWLCLPIVWGAFLEAKQKVVWEGVDSDLEWIHILTESSSTAFKQNSWEATWISTFVEIYICWNQGTKSQEESWILHNHTDTQLAHEHLQGIELHFELGFNWFKYQGPFTSTDF